MDKASRVRCSENALDLAYARLSIAALTDNEVSQDDDLFKAKDNIKDPHLRRFMMEVSLLVSDFSASEAIAEVEKLEGTSDRIYLLRKWAKRHRKRQDADLVLGYALKMVIGATEYAPNATVLRELAEPLPFLEDFEKVRRLVSLFDSQAGAVGRLGPTGDYVRLQLLLARSESRYDSSASKNRFVDTYLYVSYIDDLATRGECLAWLKSCLSSTNVNTETDKPEELNCLIEADLSQCLEELLQRTANHFDVTKGIIRALAGCNRIRALRIAESLNTEPRRDSAYYLLADCVSRDIRDAATLKFANDIRLRITDPDQRDDALLMILERLLAMGSEIPEELVKASLNLLSSLDQVSETSERCRGYCLTYCLLGMDKTNDYAELQAALAAKLLDAWKCIDAGWVRLDVGFRIGAAVAKSDTSLAQEWVSAAERLREEMVLSDDNSTWTYVYCLRLAIRAFSGLFKKGIDGKDDVTRIAALIDRIPSFGEQARLWAEMALRYYCAERKTDCSRIVSQRVRPLLGQVSEKDSRYRHYVVAKTAPALYCGHSPTALEMIKTLPENEREDALEATCRFLLRKVAAEEPFEPTASGTGPEVSHEELTDVCTLLDLMRTDYRIYAVIQEMADRIVARKSKYSLEQRLALAKHLEQTIHKTLPDSRNIRHDGYVIAARSQVARIQQTTPQQWLELVSAAKLIPNLADQVLVLAIIASAMPAATKDRLRRMQALEDSVALVDSIPAVLDRVEHYEMLAFFASDFATSTARDCLRSAMTWATKQEGPDYYECQRRIVDFAYRIDTEFAASLASIANDDPARMNLKERLSVLELKSAIANNDKVPTGREDDSPGRHGLSWAV